MKQTISEARRDRAKAAAIDRIGTAAVVGAWYQAKSLAAVVTEAVDAAIDRLEEDLGDGTP